MANISLTPTHAHKLTPNIRNLKECSFSHHHKLAQQIDQELTQNHALELDPEPDSHERLEPKESDDDYNPDYDKPIDEYETGDPSTTQEPDIIDFLDILANLEQATIQRFIEDPDQLEHALQCIDFYRIHGYLPEEADSQLQEDLAALEKSTSYQKIPSVYPAFEVMVEADHVEASVVPIGLNLKYVRGLGPFSTSAKNFIKIIHERNRLLNDLAYYLLEIIQGEFFRQQDLNTALRYLLPVPIKELSTLPIDSPFKIDKQYLSDLGDLLVSCRLGIFPLNFFLQQKAQIVRMWVNFAIRNKKVTKKEQLDWIRKQIEKRTKKWDSNDDRYGFISPLKSITIDDIKYAHKIALKQ